MERTLWSWFVERSLCSAICGVDLWSAQLWGRARRRVGKPEARGLLVLEGCALQQQRRLVSNILQHAREVHRVKRVRHVDVDVDMAWVGAQRRLNCVCDRLRPACNADAHLH